MKRELSRVEALRAESQQIKQELAEIKALLLTSGRAVNAASRVQLYQNEPNPTEGSTVIRYFACLEYLNSDRQTIEAYLPYSLSQTKNPS